MKRNLFTMLLVMLVAFGANAQYSMQNNFGGVKTEQPVKIVRQNNVFGTRAVIMSEDFSAGLPSGWTNVDVDGGTFLWTFNNPGAQTINTTTNANGFAIVDSDNNGGGAENIDLITSAINCSANTNVTLSFEHYFKSGYGGAAEVFISNDGGTVWTSLASWSATSSANAALETYDVTALAAGQADVRIKWNWQGNYSWYWAIDDIKLFEPDPDDLSALAVWPMGSNGAFEVTPWAKIKNVGGNAATGFDVAIVITDASSAEVYNETKNFADNVASGAEFNATMDVAWTPSGAGVYTVTATITYAADVNAANNVATSTFTVVDGLLWGANIDNTGSTNGIVSTYFGGISQSVETADDFILPAGNWNIDSIPTRGFTNLATAIDGFDVIIYDDNAGEPGAVVFSELVAETNATNQHLTFTNPLHLTGGVRYWLAVTAHYNSASALADGRWNWYTWDNTTLGESMLRDNPNLFGGGTAWGTLSALGVAGSGSTNFAIYGTSLTPSITIDTPANGSSTAMTEPTLSFTVANFNVAAAGLGDGHVHYTVDGGSVVMVYNTNDITLPTLTLGNHTIVMTLVDDAHAPIVPAVSATSTFEVRVAATDATLSDLTSGGTTVTGFAAATMTYAIELPYGTAAVPAVTATPTDANATAVVTPAAALPGATTVLVTAEDGTTTATYTINYTIAPPPTATVTFLVTDLSGKYAGFGLKGSWSAAGVYDNTWNGGAEQAMFYDDGTNGDVTSGDKIWTAVVNLTSDAGANTWEWGIQDENDVWIAGNWQFTVADGTAQELTYTVVVDVATLAELRAGTVGATYRVTGESVLTYQQSFRNQKFVQDASGAILIDDNSDVLATAYNLGDGITNLEGTLSPYNDMMQLVPTKAGEAASSTGNTVTPQVITGAEFVANFENYEAELVTIEDVTFADAGSNFANGTVYNMTDASARATVKFRTNFYNVDYTGSVIVATANVTGICIDKGASNDGHTITARNAADIQSTVGVNTLSDVQFSIYPNPSNGTFAVSVTDEFNLEVIDIAGKVVSTQTINSTNNTVSIAQAGVYFLRFSNATSTSVQRVIVK